MRKWITLIPAMLVAFSSAGCADFDRTQPTSASGVNKATVHVDTDPQGLTTEQHNIMDRLHEDNKPGSIKHLYVISAYSGQVIIYSTVRGKVTSGGKRLTPTTVAAIDGQYVGSSLNGIPVNVGGRDLRTGEVLQDDGTYGHSMDYLYWWDSKGVYHQHYVSGGQILHISSQPIATRSIILNLEASQKSEPNTAPAP